jgi:hypothetical protein
MNDIKETLVNECLDVLKRKDVKDNIKQMFTPIIDMILKELYPYIYLSILFVLFSFFIILANFILFLRMSKRVGKNIDI